MKNDYLGLKEGDKVKISTYGTVVEVGRNYAEVETDDGWDQTVNINWEVKIVEDFQ